jgi:hypothetical protein
MLHLTSEAFARNRGMTCVSTCCFSALAIQISCCDDFSNLQYGFRPFHLLSNVVRVFQKVVTLDKTIFNYNVHTEIRVDQFIVSQIARLEMPKNNHPISFAEHIIDHQAF